MSFVYKCNHCTQTIGTLPKRVDWCTLGLDSLSETEKRRMIHYDARTGWTSVYVICDSCLIALESHPQYYELDYFIH